MQIVNPLVNPSVHLAGTLAGTRALGGVCQALPDESLAYAIGSQAFLLQEGQLELVGMLDLSRGWQRHWAVMIC